MIDQSTIDRIFSSANIVDIVSDFVSLKKKGTNYQACCPFHNEKTPSFVVSPAKGLFKCFGCGKAGNAVTFVMEHEHMNYVEALRYVAKRYGIEIEEQRPSPEQQKRNDDRQSMLAVNAYANDYFRNRLHNTIKGQNVGLSYFRERGFSDATIQKFQLGYCSDTPDEFSNKATADGYREEYLVATGLTIKRESGGYYDRFCDRIMFPIHSISGTILGFGGRTMRTDKKTAKYLNSPESEIYHKSDILYGLFFAKSAISKNDNCILVEGYTDVISMHQSGVENVVASSGTSLTEGQIALISRFTKNVTVIYDGDSAGIKASLRGIDMLLKAGLNVRVVPLPEGEDPDSFARAHTAAQLTDYIDSHVEDFISFKTGILLRETVSDPIARASVIKDIVDSIAVIPDKITRSVYVKECARMMDVSETMLEGEVARIRGEARYEGAERVQAREAYRNLQQKEIHRHKKEIVQQETLWGSSIEELEHELIGYLLKFGHCHFDCWIEGGKQRRSVANSIISELVGDGITMRNPVYDKIFNLYAEAWYAALDDVLASTPEDDTREVAELLEESGWQFPIHTLMSMQDQEITAAVGDIMMQNINYKVSRLWKQYDIIVETEEQRLKEAIPRVIPIYKSKIIESIIEELKTKLCGEDLSEEVVEQLLVRINKLNTSRLDVCQRFSRIIL